MPRSTPILPRPLRAKIIALLAVKLIALIILYWLFFGPSHQFQSDSRSTAARVLGLVSTP
jgi:hypothetical protein